MRFAAGAYRFRGRVLAATTVWAVLFATLVLPMSPADAVPDETYADDFSPADWDGSDGSIPWLNPWVENGESDGIDTGSIRIGDEPQCPTNPCLLLGRDAGPSASATRQVDLSGFATAQLDFDYRIHPHDAGAGSVSLWINSDGGSSWTQLDSWQLDTNETDSAVFDITEFMGSGTTIRFVVYDNTDDSHMNVDNVVITASGRQGYFDEFTDLTWDGSDGSLDWAPDPWQDSGGNGPTFGLIQVIANSFCASGNCLRIEGSTFVAGHNVVREVDLTGATFASLLFNYRRENYNTCSVQLDVSDDGGGSWAPLATYGNNGGDASQQSEAVDIFSHAAVNTQIRFSVDGVCTPGEFFYADNIWVYTDAAPTTNNAPVFDQDLLDITDNIGAFVAIDSPATDPDGSDTLTYNASGLPDGIAIDSASGFIGGVLSPNSAGVHAVEITVADDGTPSLDDSDVFTWTVGAGEAFYLIAGSGGSAGGDDLLTGFNPGDFDESTNEVDIGIGMGTSSAEGADVDPDTGKIYAGVDDQVGTIDPSTGVFTALPSVLGSGNGSEGAITFDSTNALAFHPSNGDLYVVIGRISGEDLLIKADPTTGAHIPGAFGGEDYVPIEGLSFGREWNTGIDFDPTTETLYGVTSSFTTTTLITIDLSNGQTSEVGDTEYATSGLAFDASGQLWGIRTLFSSDSVFEIDKATGSESNSRPVDNGSQYRAMAIAGTPQPNQAPVFDQDLLNRSDAEGTLIDIAAPATDPDVGDTLTYSAIGLPEGVTIDTANGDIAGALGPNSAGTHSVVITVVDDGVPSLQDIDSFTWTVSSGEPTYLVAAEGGGGGGNEALLTAVNLADTNQATNEVTIGDTTGRTNVEGLAIHPVTGVLFGSHNDQLGTIDITTGIFTPLPSVVGIGSGPAGTETLDTIEALSFDPSTGALYAIHRPGSGTTESMLVEIDPATGARVSGSFGGDDYLIVQPQGSSYQVPGMAHDPTTGVLFIIHWDDVGGEHWYLTTLDPATGATTTVGNIPNDITGLSFSGDGRPYGITDQSSGGTIYEFDKADGSVVRSLMIDNTSQYKAIAIAADAVPNLPPVFDQDLLDRTDAEGSAISLSAAATDPDLDDLTYTATGLPGGLSVDPNTGLISGTIDFTAAGTHPVEITVTDDGIPNLAATDTFHLDGD